MYIILLTDLANYFSYVLGMYLIVVNLSRLLTLTRKASLLTNITLTETSRTVSMLKISLEILM